MKKYLLLALFASAAFSVYLLATESDVIGVGGGAGITPGSVMTVTHTGETPTAATIKVPLTVNGSLSPTGAVSAASVSATTTVNAGTGYKFNSVNGFSGVITNSPTSTNLYFWAGGIVTNVVATP